MSEDRATLEAHLRKQVDAFWVEVVKGNFLAAKETLTGVEDSVSTNSGGLRKSPRELDEISKSRKGFSLLDTDLMSSTDEDKYTGGESSIFNLDVNSLWLSPKANGVSLRRISSEIICCGLIKSSTGKREARRCMLTKEVCTTKSHRDNRLDDFYAGVVCAEIGEPKSFITGCVFRYVDYPDKLLNKVGPDFTGDTTDSDPPLIMPALYWKIVNDFSPDVRRLTQLLSSAVGSATAKEVVLDAVRSSKGDVSIESDALTEILDELDSLQVASITQAELIGNLQTEFDDYRSEMEELLDDKDQVIVQLTRAAIRKGIKEFMDTQKGATAKQNGAPDDAFSGTPTHAPWKASVAEGFTALQDLESKIDGNKQSFKASIEELEKNITRLGQKISSSGVSFGDSEFNGIDDCHQYLEEHICDAYSKLNLTLPTRFNIGVMVCPLSVLFAFGALVKDEQMSTKSHSDQDKVGHLDPYMAAVMNSVCSYFPPSLYGIEDSDKPNELLKRKLDGDTNWNDAAGFCFKDFLTQQTEMRCDALETHLESNTYIISDKGARLATKMIGFSRKWLGKFFTYIDEYNRKLEAFGFKEEKFWWVYIRELVTTIISYLQDARKFAFDSRNPSVIFWANLLCISKAEEFLNHGFDSHPIVNSCLIRTIVKGQSSKSTGGGLLTTDKVEALIDKSVKKLSGDVQKLKDVTGTIKQTNDRVKSIDTRVRNLERSE